MWWHERMSPRPRRLHRRHHPRQRRPMVISPPTPLPRPNLLLEALMIKGGIVAFGLGAGMALHEGHGDTPLEEFRPTNPTGHIAIEFQVTSTSSLTSTSAFSSLSLPIESTVFNPFRLK